jgi:hypothetical protein
MFDPMILTAFTISPKVRRLWASNSYPSPQPA